jgi:conjugative relaxase-like TrwC/TraI family protein
MLSVANVSAAAAENYYAKDDYYNQDLEAQKTLSPEMNASHWAGKGSIALGLSGVIQPEQFKALLHGKDLQGNSLLAKSPHANQAHRAATDFTFSAPKSVSIAALIQHDRRVIVAHDQAVEVALLLLEERYAQTRIRTDEGRQRVKTGNITAAVFRHETSREQEPQLHSHCVVINTTQLADGSWRGLGNEQAIAHQKLLGEIYQNELAFQLRQHGYEIEHCGTGQFKLKGYSSALMNTFSTRTQQIETYLEELQRKSDRPLSASQKKQATLATRKTKKVVPREVLMEAWEKAIAQQNLRLPTLPDVNQSLDVNQSVNSTVNSVTAVQTGVNHASERTAIFTRTQVERFALEHSLGQQRFSELQRAIDSSQELILVEPTKERYTTQTAIQRELATIQLMQMGQGQVDAIATSPEIFAHLENLSLTEGQRGAITISATTSDRIIAWQGVAGSGKTFSLKLFKDLAEFQGYTMKGFAPSATAVKVLAQEAQIPSETIAHLLQTKLEPSLLGKEIWVVDEAGLLSAKDAHELLTKATEQSARVILVGDTRQLSAVGAGNPFKSLQSDGIQTAYLKESLRQKTQVLKEAIASVNQGDMGTGIQQLEQAAMIRELPDREERLRQIAQDYLALTPEEQQTTLVIVGTNADRHALAQQIRSGLQAAGHLGEDVCRFSSLRTKDLTMTQAKYAHHYVVNDVIIPVQDYKKQRLLTNQQYRIFAIDVESNQVAVIAPNGNILTINPAICERKTVYQSHPISVAVGDRLRWTRGDRTQDIRNGQTFIINTITPKGQATITHEDHKTSKINLNDIPFADYAQVSTCYSSQGKTADRVLAMVDRTTSKEAFYVTISRAKLDLTLYTPDKAELQAQPSRAKENPSEYLPLLRSNDHAQNEETRTNPDYHHGGERVGASVSSVFASPLRGDCPLETAGRRLDRSTNDLTAASHDVKRFFDGICEDIDPSPECNISEFSRIAELMGERIEEGIIEEITAAIGTVVESLGDIERSLGFQSDFAAENLRDAAAVDPDGGASESAQAGDPSSQPGRNPVLEHNHYLYLWNHYSQGLEGIWATPTDTVVGIRAHEDGYSLDDIAQILRAGSRVIQKIGANPQEAASYLESKLRMIAAEVLVQWQMEKEGAIAQYQALYRDRTQGLQGLNAWELDVRVAQRALNSEKDLKEVSQMVAQSPLLRRVEQEQGRSVAWEQRVVLIAEARRRNFAAKQVQKSRQQQVRQKTKQKGLEMD